MKDLTIFATARVILELSEQLPCVAAVVVSLLAKPKPVIKYTLKAVGGSLTALPGLADVINVGGGRRRHPREGGRGAVSETNESDS